MQPEDHDEIKHLIRQNTELLKQNHKLLKRLNSYHVWGIWFKIIWVALLIGLPFALYFYILEPYFAAFGASYEQFRVGLQEIPGLKGLEQILPQ